MKKQIVKLTSLLIPFILLGCTQIPTESNISEESYSKSSESMSNSSSISSNKSSNSSNSSNSSKSNSSSSSSSKNSNHAEHNWDTTWTYDPINHWHACKESGCDEVNDLASHNFGEWEEVDVSSLQGEDRYKFATNTKVRKCKICGYSDIQGENIIPELRFTSNVASEINFASIAKKDDLTRPEVEGTFTLTNCDDSFKKTDIAGTMKVRGNQTAGWSKKAFRIKFDKSTNLLGLNNGNQFKKWVLFADAKDTTLIRTALGLYISKAICKDEENVWVSDFTPVSVYLNNQYWGYYYLAEQKEVKGNNRIKLPEVKKGYTGTDIGYCFELDHYAEDEPKKPDGGDPTFSVNYVDYSNKKAEISYNIESTLANFGVTKTYTMLSDITDGPENTALNDKNSNQVAFIKKRMECLYTVLYEAAVNKKAKAIVDNTVTSATDSIEKVINDNFDLNTWADGFIINAYSCPPDVGYSSFYMSFDNSETGDKKLRYDNPWDFDSNFGNRRSFITTGDDSNSSGQSQGQTGWPGGQGWGGMGGSSYDAYYMDRTSNMWLQLLGKLDFFMDIVKAKWNQIREEQVFEGMFKMMRTYFKDFDAEYQRNFAKWPKNDAADMSINNFDEIRDPFKDPKKYIEAEQETITWCANRVNYLEKKWGNNRPDVDTNP